jgi:hypothetical protein
VVAGNPARILCTPKLTNTTNTTNTTIATDNATANAATVYTTASNVAAVNQFQHHHPPTPTSNHKLPPINYHQPTEYRQAGPTPTNYPIGGWIVVVPTHVPYRSVRWVEHVRQNKTCAKSMSNAPGVHLENLRVIVRWREGREQREVHCERPGLLPTAWPRASTIFNTTIGHEGVLEC